jgi:hypothetical protein
VLVKSSSEQIPRRNPSPAGRACPEHHARGRQEAEDAASEKHIYQHVAIDAKSLVSAWRPSYGTGIVVDESEFDNKHLVMGYQVRRNWISLHLPLPSSSARAVSIHRAAKADLGAPNMEC